MKNLLLALVATLLLAAGCDTLPDDGGMKFDDGKYHNQGGYIDYRATFQPGHGYVAMMKLDDNQVCSVALYAKDYTLERNGSLHTVTLHYKLID